MSDPKQKAIIRGNTVFLPAALFGNPKQILYCYGYDGTETIQDGGRLYCSADWLATEFPEHRQRISTLVKTATEATQ